MSTFTEPVMPTADDEQHVRRGDVATLRRFQKGAIDSAERVLNQARRESRELTSQEQAVYNRALESAKAWRAMIDDAQQNERTVLAHRRAERSGDTELANEVRHLLKRGGGAIEVDVASRIAQQIDRDQTEIRTITTSNGIEPKSIVDRVFFSLVRESAVLSAQPTMFNTEDGAPLLIPRFTAFSIGSAIAEAGTLVTSDPTISNVILNSHKYGAFVQMSTEASQDATFGVARFVADQLALAVGTAISNVLVNGTGTTEPTGLFHAATVGVTGTAANFLPTASEIVDLYFSVGASYRPNAAWIMSDATYAHIRKLTDTTGRFLVDSLGGVSNETLLGRPVLTDPRVASAGSAVKSIYFGDVERNFCVRMAGNLRVESSVHYSFNTDLVTMRALQRLDSAILDTSAGRLFQGKTT